MSRPTIRKGTHQMQGALAPLTDGAYSGRTEEVDYDTQVLNGKVYVQWAQGIDNATWGTVLCSPSDAEKFAYSILNASLVARGVLP
jgi:hypothetical protein